MFVCGYVWLALRAAVCCRLVFGICRMYGCCSLLFFVRLFDCWLVLDVVVCVDMSIIGLLVGLFCFVCCSVFVARCVLFLVRYGMSFVGCGCCVMFGAVCCLLSVVVECCAMFMVVCSVCVVCCCMVVVCG